MANDNSGFGLEELVLGTENCSPQHAVFRFHGGHVTGRLRWRLAVRVSESGDLEEATMGFNINPSPAMSVHYNERRRATYNTRLFTFPMY